MLFIVGGLTIIAILGYLLMAIIKDYEDQ